MTACMILALAEARSASVPQGNAVARVTMGKVAARSKEENTDACVMCKKTFRAPYSRFRDEASGGQRMRLGTDAIIIPLIHPVRCVRE